MSQTLTPLQALINLADLCDDVFEKPAENCDLIAAKKTVAAYERESTDRFKDDAVAETIYNGWSEQAGWVPWIAHGNSQMQDVARDEARARSQVTA